MKTGDCVVVVTRVYPSGHLFSKVFTSTQDAAAWVEEHREQESKATFVMQNGICVHAPEN